MTKPEYPLIDTYTTELHGQTVTVRVFAPQISPDVGMVGSTQSLASRITEAQPRAPLAFDFKAISYDGRTQSLKAWAEECRVGANTLARRLRSGWSVDDALTIPATTQGGFHA